MSSRKNIRVLLVEDDATQVRRLRRAFAGFPDGPVKHESAASLAAALERLRSEVFDIVLLDLNLPDSRGLDTFAAVHRVIPSIPVLVLASAGDEAFASQAVEQGAQDYLFKTQIRSALLTRSISYALERSRLLQALAEKRQKEQQEREFIGIDRLTEAPGTAVTSRIYSGGTLREKIPNEFDSFVERYMETLDHALEMRMFKVDRNGAQHLQAVADELGFMRASPRDVIEIHSTALKSKVKDVPWQKAQAYLQEGRIIVLELMGYLTSFYRSHCPTIRPGKLES